jgi:hypothetical protein
MGNPAFEWGEVRCMGGGIVLPPYPNDSRRVAKAGKLMLLFVSSSFEPVSIGVGEGIVTLSSTFDPRDHGGPDSEVVGNGGESDVLGLPGWSQVGPIAYTSIRDQGEK